MPCMERLLTVELTTAYELSDEEADEILRQIEQASGRRVEAERKVDPDLIGGIVLQVGSRRVDASVRGRLNRLRQERADPVHLSQPRAARSAEASAHSRLQWPN